MGFAIARSRIAATYSPEVAMGTVSLETRRFRGGRLSNQASSGTKELPACSRRPGLCAQLGISLGAEIGSHRRGRIRIRRRGRRHAMYCRARQNSRGPGDRAAVFTLLQREDLTQVGCSRTNCTHRLLSLCPCRAARARKSRPVTARAQELASPH